MADETTPLFEIHDAVVRRSGKEILHVDDFVLQEGCNMALLGPNGSGKSTFIQLLTREILPLYRDRPPVCFRGNPRPLLTDVRSCVAVVSGTMEEQVRVHLCVGEIVCGGLFGTLGLPQNVHALPEHHLKSMEAMATMRIADLADRDIMTLSSGQLRRVLIARELVKDPSILVFDEPCTGLDPQGMHHVRHAMRTLAQQGKTVILITHYSEDIIPEIERVMLIKDARIVADGPKEQLLTSQTMSDLFDVPITVREDSSVYTMVSAY